MAYRVGSYNHPMSGIKLVDSTAEEYRRRLEKMSDEKLVQFGKDAPAQTDAAATSDHHGLMCSG